MNNRITALALWPAAVLALAGSATGQTRARALEAGRWPVGFATMARAHSPLEIGIWYSARDSAGTRLTFRRYFLDAASRDSSLAAELTGLTGFLTEHGAPEAEVAAWLDQPMLASADVEPAGPRFPLATTPSPMRVTGPLAGEEDIGRRAEEQANDLAEANSALASRPDVRPGGIGVVGHSFGARAALLYAMRGSDVRALVSLDGEVGTATGRSSQEAAPSYRAAAMRAPLLHFYQRLDPFMGPDFGLLCTLRRSTRWVVEVPDLHHHHFTSLGAAILLHPALGPALRARAETAEAYRAVTEATLEFLDVFVRQEQATGVRGPALTVRRPRGPPRRLGVECH
jgi:dienelactone hydrolase